MVLLRGHSLSQLAKIKIKNENTGMVVTPCPFQADKQKLDIIENSSKNQPKEVLQK